MSISGAGKVIQKNSFMAQIKDSKLNPILENKNTI